MAGCLAGWLDVQLNLCIVFAFQQNTSVPATLAQAVWPAWLAGLLVLALARWLAESVLVASRLAGWFARWKPLLFLKV